jgi:hypothetical protein
MECRMLKLTGQRKNLIILNSMFDIRYSLRAYGKFIISELPAAKELAEPLQNAGTVYETPI